MKILIVDDHALVRAGVKRLLTGAFDADILEAAESREGLNILRSSRMDLILLDLNLPGLGGVELLRRFIQLDVGPVLVLSMHAEPIYVRRSLDVGAAGYVSKNISPDELMVAVNQITGGGRYVEAEIAQSLVVQDMGQRPALDSLSPRELEIMRLLASGASMGEIAASVDVSYKTVANNCSDIKAKLGVSRTAGLVRLALATGVH
jgi:DNA-binding NarL/FixJ family response regulator